MWFGFDFLPFVKGRWRPLDIESQKGPGGGERLSIQRSTHLQEAVGFENVGMISITWATEHKGHAISGTILSIMGYINHI